MDPNRPPSRDLSAYSYGSVVNRDDNGNIDVSGVTLDTMVSRGIPKEAIREKYEQTIRDYQKFLASESTVTCDSGANRQGQYSGPETHKPVAQTVPGAWSPENASQDSDVLRTHYQNFGNTTTQCQQSRTDTIGGGLNLIDYGVNQLSVSPQRAAAPSQPWQNDSGMLGVQQGDNPRAQIAINPPSLSSNHTVHEPRAIKPEVNRLPTLEEHGSHAQTGNPGAASGHHREQQTMRAQPTTPSRPLNTTYDNATGAFLTQRHGDNGKGVDYQPRITSVHAQGNQESPRALPDIDALDREVEAAWLKARRGFKPSAT
ncbi:hypothetical protein CGMCC3_g16768 [Colletotrichum fructicola]|uniref:Uncharacterized protein n=1 Tax=Colletotrichum fructicola (strain Nara gc5) TaxID=1213859 RepID=L2FI11_COLFN|nr:uncharacterized protein CGMCC3_g16768 [Colletotrichum fructicola]KAE9567073.1 hypothetical protein CGMCC3_g16768 [Colletotrichum fructicola]KAF4418564.1 hypothetical protein CFRS1_v015630 [Colletotrichum fructicola]KAF5482704.1 hypothetical protein CGCF413_v015592 [Colletotrichum fructicola]